jgi:hypothetical protein
MSTTRGQEMSTATAMQQDIMELFRHYISLDGECPRLLSRTEAHAWDASAPDHRLPLSGDEVYLAQLRLIVCNPILSL